MNKDIQSLATEIQASLDRDILAKWFPACVADRGFHQNFAEDWTRLPGETRSVVFQSRMTWVTATIEDKATALHGLTILKGLQDASGGFRWDDQSTDAQIHAYGVSFALYALAAVARVAPDSEALAMAASAFAYLEAHRYDFEFGGYLELQLSSQARDAIATPPGQKSQNTHLHLLEAFTELYAEWPDDQLRFRLNELLSLFLNEFYVAPGWLHTHVQRDWTPVAGDISHGHDVEAAHLILAAAKVLGREDDVRTVVQSLVDFALEKGWDSVGGGFYNAGRPDGSITDSDKIWWVQAEGLLALATLYQLTSRDRYLEALNQQWTWIKTQQIDSVNGGWFEQIPHRPGQGKGNAWKAAYHDGRAMIYTLRILRSL